jgi:hypothetical protein
MSVIALDRGVLEMHRVRSPSNSASHGVGAADLVSPEEVAFAQVGGTSPRSVA